MNRGDRENDRSHITLAAIRQPVIFARNTSCVIRSGSSCSYSWDLPP